MTGAAALAAYAALPKDAAAMLRMNQLSGFNRRKAVSYDPLFTILTDLSLTTNLEVCLDAGDADSYDGSAQSWLDRTANGFDFTLGQDTGASTDDPTFNGTAGGLTSAEYMGLDGGDGFEYDAANETWMDALHKDSAVFSWMMMVYVPTSPTGYIWTNGATGGTVGAGHLWTGGLPRLFVFDDTATTEIDVTADTAPNADAWNMIAGQVDEPAGTGFMYLNGAYNQVAAADTFTATYPSPGTLGPLNPFTIGANGGFTQFLNSGHRIGMVAIWEGTALTKANFDSLWTEVRKRYGL